MQGHAKDAGHERAGHERAGQERAGQERAGQERIGKPRRPSVGAIFILAGAATWPVVTAIIYWAPRMTFGITEVAPAGRTASPSIGLLAAGGYALLVSALIIAAGWLQSEPKA